NNRNAVPLATPGIAVCKMVMPLFRKLRIAVDEGAGLSADGVMRIEPDRTFTPVPAVRKRKKPAAEMVYGPANGTNAGCPSGSNACMEQLIALFRGLIRTISVAHPPPSTNWAMVCAGAGTENASGPFEISTTDNVVIRKSPRSFVIPRNASADTGSADINVKVA